MRSGQVKKPRTIEPTKGMHGLLTDRPVPWHPAIRVAALDAAFIRMCSQSIESIGQFHDVALNDYGEYGASVDVICIEKNAEGVALWDQLPQIFPICIFEPVNFVMQRGDCEAPDGLDQLDFIGTRDELIQYLADHELVLNHVRDMRNRYGQESPFFGLFELINVTEVFAANRGFNQVLNASTKQLPALPA